MNRDAFLRGLSDGLAGLPAREVEEILDDYSAYFDEGLAAGRSEADVAAALGDPARLARASCAPRPGCGAGRTTTVCAIRRPRCWRSAVSPRSTSSCCCRCCSRRCSPCWCSAS